MLLFLSLSSLSFRLAVVPRLTPARLAAFRFPDNQRETVTIQDRPRQLLMRHDEFDSTTRGV